MGGIVQNKGGGGWLIDYGAGQEPQGADFICSSYAVDHPAVTSLSLVSGFKPSHKEASITDGSSSRKRNRVESCAEPGTKASREKLRRDKLNDRFSELASILDPAKPTSDKVAVLNDATRRINQLRLEVQRFKESNDTLQESIKRVKEEKVELRDEKMRLKAEKERLQKILQDTSIEAPCLPHHSAMTYHARFTPFGKTVSNLNCPPVAMWQWIPPKVLDTSEDHVLRPPVA